MYLDQFLELTLIAKAFKGIKIAVGVLILDAALTMIKKMPTKPFPRAVMLCAFGAMLAVNLFSLTFSSVSLMLIAGLVSLALFIAKGAPNMKGGEGK